MVTKPPIIRNIAANQAYMYINAGINTIMIAIIIPSTNIALPLICTVSTFSPPNIPILHYCISFLEGINFLESTNIFYSNYCTILVNNSKIDIRKHTDGIFPLQ